MDFLSYTHKIKNKKCFNICAYAEIAPFNVKNEASFNVLNNNLLWFMFNRINTYVSI